MRSYREYIHVYVILRRRISDSELPVWVALVLVGAAITSVRLKAAWLICAMNPRSIKIYLLSLVLL